MNMVTAATPVFLPGHFTEMESQVSTETVQQKIEELSQNNQLSLISTLKDGDQNKQQ